jgi:hypothetical protein
MSQFPVPKPYLAPLFEKFNISFNPLSDPGDRHYAYCKGMVIDSVLSRLVYGYRLTLDKGRIKRG